MFGLIEGIKDINHLHIRYKDTLHDAWVIACRVGKAWRHSRPPPKQQRHSKASSIDLGQFFEVTTRA